ncbi:cytosine deaminase [Paraburkholderia sp. 2C]
MMSRTFISIPRQTSYTLRNANLPACLFEGAETEVRTPQLDFVNADIFIKDGMIAAISPAGTARPETGPDVDRSMVLPGMIDCHAHLDKAQIAPRTANITGDFAGASVANREDRAAHWTADDVRRRMEFGLLTALAHGVVAIRTNLDCHGTQADITLPVFCELRDQWAGRIELQANALIPLQDFLSIDVARFADRIAQVKGSIGSVLKATRTSTGLTMESMDEAVTRLLRVAAERDLDVDLHVDETGDQDSRTLADVARIATRERFPRRLTCSHCCSLALQSQDFIDQTLDALFAANISIVCLPTVNMYLQARARGRTPKWRGVTLVHEMKARGLQVAVAGDNCRDAFHAYGDHDMLDTFSQAVKILHLDHPFGDWLKTATATPAAIMGIEDRFGTLAAGRKADLIITRARNYSELLSRQQFDRIVLREGKVIDTTLPDYRVLDSLM